MIGQNHEVRLVLSRALFETALCHENGKGLWSVLELDFTFLGCHTYSDGDLYYLYRGACRTGDIVSIIKSSLEDVSTAIKRFRTDYYVEHSSVSGLIGNYGNKSLVNLFESNGAVGQKKYRIDRYY